MSKREFIPGSKVTLKHRDGSVLVTKVRADGALESGHIPPINDPGYWIETYGWTVDSIDIPVPPRVKALARLLEESDYDWSTRTKTPYITRAEFIWAALDIELSQDAGPA